MNRSTKEDITVEILDLKPHAVNIIDRMILDPELKTEIIEGLKLAGLSVK